ATTDHPDFPEVAAQVVANGLADDDWMEAFTVEETALADLLWVVDNSCSMEPEQTALAALGGQVIDFLTAEGVDYQLGVVTTDNAHLQGAEPVMTPWTANVAEVFEATVQVGTAGDGIEQPLHHAWSALSAPLTDPGGPNDGFLRDGAALAVIVVTDEDDQSTEPVDELASIFSALKPDPTMVALNAVHPGETGCTAPDGWIDAAPRLHATVALMGGVEVSVCDVDWSAAWTGVPDLLLGPLRVYELTFSPMPATLEISVGGVPLVDGWSYDEDQNAIVFDVDAVPEVGTEILVYYVEPADECP
ncbi:MAG: vWA domain-containing protein, partial [Myxococcota bacterium]|nr:vWA domain-containing protein [Myxococcota bacterium]